MMARNHIYLLLLIIVLLCGCGFDSIRGIKPDDELSACVSDSIGETFRYLGKEQNYDGGIDYKYYAPYESITVENINQFLNAVSSLPVEESDHLVFSLCPQISGGYGGTCSLQNYIDFSNDGENTLLEFSSMCVFIISYQELSDPILTEPSTFIGVEGVRYLVISSEMQEKAEEASIDWYKIWPDLEGVEVF